jgi:Bacterial CdiA-CT RNAse A domain
MGRLSLILAVLAVALGGLVACHPTSSTSAATAERSGRAGAGTAIGPARDLNQDEAAGGHVLRKHVGRTDEQLLERLDHEPNITGASTYTDRTTAERIVGAAIAQSQDRIQHWLNRSGHPNLVLEYDSDQPIGRTIIRGESQSRACSHALVVLKYDPPSSYYVLTSYPECR